MNDKVCSRLPESSRECERSHEHSELTNKDDTGPAISHSDASTSIIHLDKDELLDKLYKLNEDNLVLSEQLKQYRVMVETLELKLTELNNIQNKKHQQITDTLLKILVRKKAQLKGGSKHSKVSKRSKRSRKHHSKSHKKRSSKHSKR